MNGALFLALLLGALPALRGNGAPHPPGASTGRTVIVRPWFGPAPLQLAAPVGQTAAGDPVTVTAFRYYFGALTLRFADGSTYRDPVAYHLVDAEEAASWTIALPDAPAKPIAALDFRLGVDSAANVAGALGGALDPALGMYWAWQSGYINAKVEGTSPHRPALARRAFAFHVGGYARPNATCRAVTLPCAAPTTAVTLTVLADVARWLGAAALTETPDVLTPGPAAAVQADRAAAMFRWAEAPVSAAANASE